MTNFSSARNEAYEAGSTAADAVKNKITSAGDVLKDNVDKVQADATAAAKSIRDHVVERPLTSLMIGLAAGVVAGLLLSHRR